jgi:O-antigen ligase
VATTRSVFSPRVGPVGLRRGVPLSTLILYVGIFSVSWDRFLNVDVGGSNVKLSTVAFVLAAFLTLTDRLREPVRSGKQQAALGATFLVLVVYAVMCVFAADRSIALTQWLTVLLGATVPFLAVYGNVRLFGRVDGALTAFIRGGVFAGIFGLYQLAAFYTHLPQFIVYTDTSGGLGRISSFSYESGYFGYFLIMVIAAVFARAVHRQEPVHRGLLVFFVLVLLLTNSRASFLTVPILVVLLFARRPQELKKSRVLPVVAGLIFAALVATLAKPALAGQILARAATIFDPTEQSSNAPRLAFIDLAIRVVRDHFWTGLGPGNLILFSNSYGMPVPVGQTPNSWIVNDVWLQALVDGGIFLLVAESIFVVVVVVAFYRRRYPVARILMAGWIAAFIVSSLITSYYFNTELWVVSGLAAAVVSLSRQQRDIAAPSGEENESPESSAKVSAQQGNRVLRHTPPVATTLDREHE